MDQHDIFLKFKTEFKSQQGYMTKSDQILEVIMDELKVYGITIDDVYEPDPQDFIPRRSFRYNGRKLNGGWVNWTDEELTSTYFGIAGWQELPAMIIEGTLCIAGILRYKTVEEIETGQYDFAMFVESDVTVPRPSSEVFDRAYAKIEQIMSK